MQEFKCGDPQDDAINHIHTSYFPVRTVSLNFGIQILHMFNHSQNQSFCVVQNFSLRSKVLEVCVNGMRGFRRVNVFQLEQDLERKFSRFAALNHSLRTSFLTHPLDKIVQIGEFKMDTRKTNKSDVITLLQLSQNMFSKFRR